MKKTAVLLAVLALIPFAHSQSLDANTRQKTFALLPGQTLNITNGIVHHIEIRSEYPIQIAAGACHNDYTVQWVCQIDYPADVFIRDLRQKPIFHQPRANTVTITATR